MFYILTMDYDTLPSTYWNDSQNNFVKGSKNATKYFTKNEAYAKAEWLFLGNNPKPFKIIKEG